MNYTYKQARNFLKQHYAHDSEKLNRALDTLMYNNEVALDIGDEDSGDPVWSEEDLHFFANSDEED